MLKSSLLGLAAMAAVLSATAPAAAQTAPATEPYTFVAQWAVPRAQWAAYVTDFDKNTKPVLEKHAAAGTLISWGAFESIVHEKDGYTHGVWWTSTSICRYREGPPRTGGVRRQLHLAQCRDGAP